jgi:predicted metal-dependent hydrolase
MKVEYDIIYSDRKTLTISVERNRSVVVRAPNGTSPEKIRAAVEGKKLWLYEKTKHSQKYDKPERRKEFISGASILYLGKSYKLDVTKDDLERIHFNGKFIIPQALIPYATEQFKAWYIGQAKRKIIPRVEYHARQLGVEYRRVLISDLRYRWGSCTPSNSLNFNWRLIKAPMNVVEYVIVHELAHLIEPNHTGRFWGIVRTQVPKYLSAKEWLKEHGAILEEEP